jgi:hypothetical protein
MAKAWTYIAPHTRHPVHVEVAEGPITDRLVRLTWLVSQRDLVRAGPAHLENRASCP